MCELSRDVITIFVAEFYFIYTLLIFGNVPIGLLFLLLIVFLYSVDDTTSFISHNSQFFHLIIANFSFQYFSLLNIYTKGYYFPIM